MACGQRRAGFGDGDAADEGFGEGEGVSAELADCFEDADGFRGDLGADAVAGQTATAMLKLHCLPLAAARREIEAGAWASQWCRSLPRMKSRGSACGSRRDGQQRALVDRQDNAEIARQDDGSEGQVDSGGRGAARRRADRRRRRLGKSLVVVGKPREQAEQVLVVDGAFCGRRAR